MRRANRASDISYRGSKWLRDPDRRRRYLGGVSSQAAAGGLVLRPGVHDDGAGVERDHLPRRRRRDPPLPGLPDRAAREQSTYLEVAYLLLHGELPTAEQLEAWTDEITTTPSSTRTCASGSSTASTTTPTRWGCSSRPSAALSTFYPEAKDIFDPEIRHKQIVRLIAKMPTLAAAATASASGCPSSTRTTRSLPENFLSMMWKVAEPRYEADPVLARAIDVLFILHADHEQNCSTTAMRVVGSSHADPYSAAAAACRRPLRPRHGGANEEVLKMLTEIGSIENVPAFVRR
jgi:citrate synthase